jgi:GTPase SAR1 family protein
MTDSYTLGVQFMCVIFVFKNTIKTRFFSNINSWINKILKMRLFFVLFCFTMRTINFVTLRKVNVRNQKINATLPKINDTLPKIIVPKINATLPLYT